jgi:hypothetical protein
MPSHRRAALLLAAAALVPAAGCGGDDKGSGDLRWVGKPVVATPPDLPNDRVLRGTVENGTLRRIDVKARDLHLVDADGRRVDGVATFLNGYLHGLYPPTRHPAGGLPPIEQRRIGIVARIEPGKRKPLVLAWRLEAGHKPPVRVVYGPGSLPIPKER